MNQYIKCEDRNVGLCYQLSYQFQQRHMDYTLVHGYITNPFPPYQTIDHAWCMKDNKVYDAVYEKEFDWLVYEGLYKTEIEKKYSYKEAMELASKSNHYGAWHPIRDLNLSFYDEKGKLKSQWKNINL